MCDKNCTSYAHKIRKSVPERQTDKPKTISPFMGDNTNKKSRHYIATIHFLVTLNRATKNDENVINAPSFIFLSKIFFDDLNPKASPVLLQTYVYSFLQRTLTSKITAIFQSDCLQSTIGVFTVRRIVPQNAVIFTSGV